MGHLVASAIAVTARLNPVALILENVPLYAHSASAAILRTTLRDMRYEVQECVLLGTDWGELEARQRWYHALPQTTRSRPSPIPGSNGRLPRRCCRSRRQAGQLLFGLMQSFT